MQVKVYHNLDTNFVHPYKPGQRLELVDEFDTQKVAGFAEGDSINQTLEWVFRIHNTVDGKERSAKLRVRSLSVGDVVEVDGVWHAVMGAGFEPIEKEEKADVVL